MRQVREVLRLSTAGVGLNEIARRVGVAPSTVRLTLKRLPSAGLSWPLPAEMTDGALETALFAAAGTKQGHRRHAEPASHRSPPCAPAQGTLSVYRIKDRSDRVEARGLSVFASGGRAQATPRLPIAVCGHAALGVLRPLRESTRRLPAVCDQDRSALPSSNAAPNRPAR